MRPGAHPVLAGRPQMGRTLQAGPPTKLRRGAIPVSDVAGQSVTTAARLGLSAGDIVGESGYDDDVDHDLRDAIADLIESELLDDDSDEVLDAVLIWWRDGDGDLTDALINSIPLLADDGVIWLLTPKTGRDGYVEPSEIAEATMTAGLAQTTTVAGGPHWMIARLARPKSGKVRR